MVERLALGERSPHPRVDLSSAYIVGIGRMGLRRKCSSCHIRRVLYRVFVGSDVAVSSSEARCAPCWGIAAE